MLMVAEMTGSIEVLAPALIAVGIATLIVRRSDATIYRSQLRTRNDSTAHRLQFGLPLLSDVTVSEVMVAPRIVLRADCSVSEGLRRLQEAQVPGGPVADASGLFLGAVTLHSLEEAAESASEQAARPADGRHGPKRAIERGSRRRVGCAEQYP